MSATVAQELVPESESELAEAVREASDGGGPLEIVGGGTKRGLGRPMQTAATLSTSRLTGVTLYEPAELVIAARAGTPLSEIEAVLAERRQRLAFEPVTLKTLYGETGEPSVGAVAACNLSGPRRIHSGAARDALIGVRVVTGRGEAIKSGGRVMKNVTGYDLVKLMSGAFGTLGVLSEVTFKVLPTPETEATLVFGGLDDHTAAACMAAGLGSPWEVTGAAHLPGDGDAARTLLRIEGFDKQVGYRSGALAGALAEYGSPRVLGAEESQGLWTGIAELDPLQAMDGEAVWKISTAPMHGPSVAAVISGACVARHYFDWGGGLIWIALAPGEDARVGMVREAVDRFGGHATLMRAPDTVRNLVDVFAPRPDPIMALTRKLKESFDPARVLNPGRMYAGV